MKKLWIAVVLVVFLPGCTTMRITAKQAELDTLVSECRQGNQNSCQAGVLVQAEIADLQQFRAAMIGTASTNSMTYALGRIAIDNRRGGGDGDDCIVAGNTIICD